MNLKNFSLLIALFCLIMACKETEKKVIKSDSNIENQLNEIDSVVKVYQNQGVEDRVKIRVALKLVNLYKNFAKENSDHQKSPEFLFKAAGLSADPVQNYKETIKLYKKLANDYPEHVRAPYALMSAAFLLENLFMEYNNAKALYLEFMKRYPEHELFEDVKFAYENVGTLPEELLEKIEREKLKNEIE